MKSQAPGVVAIVGTSAREHGRAFLRQFSDSTGLRAEALANEDEFFAVGWPEQHWQMLGSAEAIRPCDELPETASIFWDADHKCLTAFRDLVGSHPIFFAQMGEVVVVTNNLALAVNGFQNVSPSRTAVISYIFLNFPLPPDTYYEQFRILRPGQSLMWRSNTLRVEGQVARTIAKRELNLPWDLSTFLKTLHGVLAPETSNAIFHLSGGIDSSLLCHVAASSGIRLPTLNATYSLSHPDSFFGKEVAREISALNREFSLHVESPHELLTRLIFATGGPVMALGILTFAEMARFVAASGYSRVITGIGGDHYSIGYKIWNAEHRYQNSHELLGTLIQVPPETLRPFLKLKPEPLFDNLRRTLASLGPSNLSQDIPSRIESLYFGTFLQEHMRMTQIAHALSDVNAAHPYLRTNVALQGLALARVDGRGEIKGFLRHALSGFHSIASRRPDKSQMIPEPKVLWSRWKNEVLEIFADPSWRLPGFDYDRVLETVREGPKDKQTSRLVWALLNLHLWLSSKRLQPPDLWDLSPQSQGEDHECHP